MASKRIRIDNLLLDQDNPRITKASSQREALQRIIEDQNLKLAVLAESIVSQGGLNPMDRWLVLESDIRGKYIAYEGNRRLAAIKILNNPAVLGDLEVRSAVRKRLEAAAKMFDPQSVEPIDCFVIPNRETGALWLHQRHTGANKGSGIVDWNGLATARFRGSNPALQALELVLKFGTVGADEKDAVEERFPITTLDRLLSTPAVRAIIGFEIKQSTLLTDLPPRAAVKVMERIVKDLSSGETNVTKLKLKMQQIDYARSLQNDLPDLTTRTGNFQAVQDWDQSIFAPPGKAGGQGSPGATGKAGNKGAAASATNPTRTRKLSERRVLITKDCLLTIDNPKIQEIEKELRSLQLSDHKHAISVLFRVFLETSIDAFLGRHGIPATFTNKGHTRDKSLQTKVSEAIDQLVNMGTARKDLDGISKGITDPRSAIHIDTLHAYVHNRFFTPKESDLSAAFDNSRPFFETIWN
ncbi:collagen-like protein [Mesorhizobium sp.]|uniref:collagen-like protein n=1 Tax=Mesorhizobium sp. TaxID=1871066 RepID=UPI000FE7C13F|nr:collagen-like protein [Mesorhizobium sp.]RWM80743.1 MAG: collagen-like protein [Mesorhizobium sp.]TIL72184.1 MAG: collagen-like protein [Mesorhizobium sp.]